MCHNLVEYSFNILKLYLSHSVYSAEGKEKIKWELSAAWVD